jgi:raffinose/stachyose/melibiose transport system substrate-binding protein
MSMRSTRGVLAAALMAVTVLTAACGGSSSDGKGDASKDTAPAAERPAKLSALFANTHQPALEALITDYKAVQPKTEVAPLQFLPTGDIRKLLLTRIQAGQAPDMFFVNGGNAAPSAVWPLAGEGKLLDLSDSPWSGSIPDYAKDGADFKGKTYALPVAQFLQAVAYNKDIFSKLKLEPPTSFDGLLETCKTVAKAGITPFTQGFAELNGFSVTLSTLAAQPYVTLPDWNEQRTSGQVKFATSPEWRSTLEMFTDMKKGGCYDKNVAGTTVDAAYAAFAKGKAAMSLLATVQAGALKKIDPEFSPGWFPFPGRDAANTRVVVNASGMIAVSADTKSPEQAKALLDYIAEPEQAGKFAKLSGGISADQVANCTLDSALADLTAPCQAKQIIGAVTDSWPNRNMSLGFFATALQALTVDKTTVDDVLAGFDYMWDNPDATAPEN